MKPMIIVQPGQGGIVSPLSQIGCRLHPIPPCGRPWERVGRESGIFVIGLRGMDSGHP